MDRTNHDDFKTQPVRVGFYDMEETIGKGNFAVVKLARHKITKSRVCNKNLFNARQQDFSIFFLITLYK